MTLVPLYETGSDLLGNEQPELHKNLSRSARFKLSSVS